MARKNRDWSKIAVTENQWIRLGDPLNENRRLELDNENGPGGVLKILDNQTVLHHARFMSNGFIDNTQLKLWLNIAGGPPPKTFKIEGTDAVKLTYQRKGTDPPAKPVSRAYDVSDIPVAERSDLRNLIKWIAMSQHGITTVSNLTSKPDKWFVFTTPDRHDRVREKFQQWRQGDQSVPPGTPNPRQVKVVVEEASEADESAEDMKEASNKTAASPQFPPVKITIQSESGKRISDATVSLSQIAVKGKQPVSVEGKSRENGVAIDRILPFGNYRMKIATADGWHAYVRDVKVEFEKGLDRTVIVPEPGRFAEIVIEPVPDLVQSDAIRELRFGVLRHYLTRNNLYRGVYSPTTTPEPGSKVGDYKTFPTAGNGVKEIGIKLRLHVARQLPATLDGDASQTIDWKWHSDDADGDNFVLVGNSLRPVQELSSTTANLPKDPEYFKLRSEMHRVGVLKLQLGPKQTLPLRIKVPVGTAWVLWTGYVAKPSLAVLDTINLPSLKDGEEVWLAESVKKGSEWARRIAGDEWFYEKTKATYYGHVLRQERPLRIDDKMVVELKIPTPTALESPPGQTKEVTE